MSTVTAPRSANEARTFQHFIPLREVRGVTLDEPGRSARVVIMSEGLGNLRDRNFYAREAVKSAAKVFNGKQFYVDHPSASDEENRPERSIRDLAGYFYECEIGEIEDPDTGEPLQACFAKLKFADSEPGRLAFEQMKESLAYQRRFPGSKDVYAGISINGGGVSHPATVRGMEVNMVTEIQEAFSADIVTKPARGGRFLALMQEADRMAAWKKRRRAREARAKGREAMSTATAVNPKLLKTVREARRAFRDLRTAIEAKKEGTEIQPLMLKVSEAFKGIAAIKGLEAKLAGDLKKTIESATANLTKLTKLKEQGEEMDPKALIADIKDDVDHLADAVLGDGGPADGAPVEGEGEGEGAEGEGEEGEEEGEEEGAEGEGEGENDELGMGDEEEPGDEHGDKGPAAMQYSCSSCGETNRVMPPKGFRLQRATESDPGGNGLEATVDRLRRTLEAKESRFVRHNRQHTVLLRENTQLRAENMAFKRLSAARKALKEAGVPPDIMKAQELLPFEPDQWSALIRQASRLKTKESALLRGGAGPRGGDGGGRNDDGKGDATATFKEAYKAPRDVLGV